MLSFIPSIIETIKRFQVTGQQINAFIWKNKPDSLITNI